MHAGTMHRSDSVKAVLPSLWGFAAVAAMDYVIDVQTLFLPVAAGAVVLSVRSLVLRRAGR